MTAPCPTCNGYGWADGRGHYWAGEEGGKLLVCRACCGTGEVAELRAEDMTRAQLVDALADRERSLVAALERITELQATLSASKSHAAEIERRLQEAIWALDEANRGTRAFTDRWEAA